jgi:hypothetical protein
VAQVIDAEFVRDTRPRGRIDQDEGAGKSDEGGVALRGLVASKSDPLEAFQLADCLLDASASLVEGAREEA